MKTLIALTAATLLVVTGCANQAAQDYYLAMTQAAESNSRSQEARFIALSQMAANASAAGDEGAAGSAIMALALTRTETIQPQFIESSALKWAQVLAPTVTAVGLGYMAADVSKNNSNNNKDVTINGQNTNAEVELGMQGVVTGVADGFHAGNASDALATIAGFEVIGDIATTAIDANGVVSEVAITSNTDLANNTVNSMSDLSTTTVDSMGQITSEAIAVIAIVEEPSL
jgi:hypothetical protein